MDHPDTYKNRDCICELIHFRPKEIYQIFPFLEDIVFLIKLASSIDSHDIMKTPMFVFLYPTHILFTK